jgi:hypothetical protein
MFVTSFTTSDVPSLALLYHLQFILIQYSRPDSDSPLHALMIDFSSIHHTDQEYTAELSCPLLCTPIYVVSCIVFPIHEFTL